MQAIWGRILLTVSIAIGTIDVAPAQQDEGLGKKEFLKSCASCHGASGKGDGPVAKSLVRPPSDLTKLSEKNNGVFPVARVYEVIDGRFQVLIHGTRDMPVWGDTYMQGLADPASRDFTSKAIAETLVRTRILTLVEYISTLQDKKRGAR